MEPFLEKGETQFEERKINLSTSSFGKDPVPYSDVFILLRFFL